MPRRLPENTRNSDKRLGRSSGPRFTSGFSHFPPVKEGDEIIVFIDDIGSRGDGVARVGGFLIFVPDSKTGERIRVRISEVSRTFAVAERIE